MHFPPTRPHLTSRASDETARIGDPFIRGRKTFMRKWDLLHNAGDKAYDPNKANYEWFDAHMLIGTYVESKNNLALRHKEINGADYYPKARKIWGVDANNAGIMNQPYASDAFPYNKQYSALNNIKVSVSIPSFFKDITSYPNRSIYSNKAFESEVVDQYRVFPVNQFHDIPKDRGVITDTFVFNNTFFHHTEYGLWQSFVNPNTTQATSQGEITLGNAGVFKIPSKLILDIKGGYMGTLDKSGTNTPFGRVFLDHYQGKVFLFTGEAPIEISDLGLFPFFREFVNTKSKYSMGYDWANKRLLISNHGSTKELIDFNSNSSVNNPVYLRIVSTNKHFSSYNADISTSLQNVYDFRLDQKTEIEFIVKSQNNNSANPSDYAIQILDKVYNILFTSASTGSDKIKTTLDADVYYIRVIKSSGLEDYDLYINLKSPSTISFYPKTQTWTSFHDFVPTAYLTLNGSSYAWQDSSTSFYNLSNSNDRRKNSYITFVENTQPDAFKRFERIEMNTMSGGSGGIVNPGSIPDAVNYTFNNNSFTHIHTWTDRQNSTELAFAYPTDFNTNFLSNYNPAEVTVNYYRGSFHAELPLDAVIDPYKNIFDDRQLPQGNLDINTDFRTHMKGKFLYTKLSYKNIGNTIVDKPLVLNYVKTFFKTTVA
jgi:hypothetical protein